MSQHKNTRTQTVASSIIIGIRLISTLPTMQCRPTSLEKPWRTWEITRLTAKLQEILWQQMNQESSKFAGRRRCYVECLWPMEIRHRGIQNTTNEIGHRRPNQRKHPRKPVKCTISNLQTRTVLQLSVWNGPKYKTISKNTETVWGT